MKLAVSLLSLRPGKVGGVETYVRRLLEELPRVAPQDHPTVVLDRDLAAALETPGFERVIVPRSARAIVAERVLEAFTPYRARGLERAFERLEADVVLFPQQSIFPKRAPVRAVVTAVDVQHLFLPENFGLFDRAFRAAVYPRSAAGAAKVIAISELTRRTLIERAGLSPEKVVAVPFGYTPTGAAKVAPTDRVAAPYLYYPAATFPHKNHAALIRSYAALRRRGDLAARLVFTGMRTPRWKELERLAASLGVAPDVVHLGYLPYAEIRRVFAGAEAILFPTRFEGFGIPVLEAVEFGKKVVTSRLEVFDEIGVPPDCQIDFDDPEALLAALRRPGPTVLTRAPWTWADCARRTLEILRDAAAGRAAWGMVAR
jgi:glycosyltransferase involved in cell wall biosynthesis